MTHAVHAILTAGAHDITWWQMAARAVIIFCYAVVLLRFFLVRAFGQMTALDITVAITLGSTLSRALTGNSRFLPTMLTITLLMALYAVLVHAAARSRSVGNLVKGRPLKLVQGGAMQSGAMKKAGISESDLCEALRLRTGTGDLSGIEAAWLERSGAISFVRATADRGSSGG